MAGSVAAPDVVVPVSREDAVEAFADGTDVTVIAGGTIVMPDLTYGHLRPRRALLLSRAGLGGIRHEQGRTIIGATTTVAELQDGVEPLAGVARTVADPEIRAQATIGGNLCAPPGVESPRGDLQAALIALGATVRSAGAGGERTDDVEAFLAGEPGQRLVLEVEFADPEAGGLAAVRRPHAHAYTVMAVCAARTAGTVRVAVTGAGPHAVRLVSVEQALIGGSDAETAAEEAVRDVTPHDDALASAWYRTRTLPVLVRRALGELN